MNDRYGERRRERGPQQRGWDHRFQGEASGGEQHRERVERRLQGQETIIPVGRQGQQTGRGQQEGQPQQSRQMGTLEYGGETRHGPSHNAAQQFQESFAQGQQRPRWGQTPPKQPHQQPSEQPTQDRYSERLEETREQTERRPPTDQSRQDTRSSWQERSQLGTEGHLTRSQRTQRQQSQRRRYQGGGREGTREHRTRSRDVGTQQPDFGMTREEQRRAPDIGTRQSEGGGFGESESSTGGRSGQTELRDEDFRSRGSRYVNEY